MFLQESAWKLFDNAEGEIWTLNRTAKRKIRPIINELENTRVNTDANIIIALPETIPVPKLDGPIALINTTDCTLILTIEKEELINVHSVIIGKKGRLTAEEANELNNHLDLDISPTTDDIRNWKKHVTEISTLNYSTKILNKNYKNYLEKRANIILALETDKTTSEELEKQYLDLMTSVHNLLSSTWTFQENVKSVLKSLDAIDRYNHYLQKYQDAISTATGLRHLIQHNIIFDVRWVSKYDYEDSELVYEFYVPLSDVKKERYYEGNQYDVSGDKYEPVDYYYSEYKKTIDIDKLFSDLNESTRDTYEKLASELEEDENIGPEVPEPINYFDFTNSDNVETIRTST